VESSDTSLYTVRDCKLHMEIFYLVSEWLKKKGKGSRSLPASYLHNVVGYEYNPHDMYQLCSQIKRMCCRYDTLRDTGFLCMCKYIYIHIYIYIYITYLITYILTYLRTYSMDQNPS
jgi:hypothetical protein